MTGLQEFGQVEVKREQVAFELIFQLMVKNYS